MHVRMTAITPQLSLGATTTAYTTGKTIGVPTQFKNVVGNNGGSARLMSLSLIDQNGIDGAVDLFFFNQLPTSMGADAATFALNSAESLYCLGVVKVAAADYSASSAVGVAAKANINMFIAGTQQPQPGVPGGTSIWVVAVARGSITYTSAAALYLTLGILGY
jgi:hypothetical protein